MTRSARCAPHSTNAAIGSPWPEKRSSSSLNSARSAALPTAISPSSGRPIQAAEPFVTQRKASLWLTRGLLFGQRAKPVAVHDTLRHVPLLNDLIAIRAKRTWPGFVLARLGRE